MSEFPKVFLSGPGEAEEVFRLLAPLLEARGIKSVRMPFQAQPVDAAHVSLKELSACHAMALVLQTKYGTPWTELGEKSITEVEFREAFKRSLPLFCFIDSIGSRASRLDQLVGRVRALARGRLSFSRFVATIKGREPRLVQFVGELKTAVQKTLIYEEGDFSDPKETAERLAHAIQSFRWVHPEFSSFSEWKNLLLSQYLRITHSTKDDFPPLLVRQKDREAFRSWVIGSDPKKSTAILSAHPGFGKSLFTFYCVRELIEEGSLTYSDVYVVPPGKELDLAAIRQIVPNPLKGSGPVLLIVDDADERSDFKAMLQQLASTPAFGEGRIKVLFICQEKSAELFYTQGYPLVSTTHSLGIHLARLTREDLGRNFKVPEAILVAALKVTNGIPIYLDLYFHHGYNLGTIGTHEQMVDYFLNQRLEGVVEQPQALGLLKGLALTGGISLSHPFFKEVCRELGLSESLDEPVRHLVDRGLIYPVGTKHRVTDRLVQDFVIARFWTQQPDRDKIWPLVVKAGDIASTILENAARAEWARALTGATNKPFEDIWAAIRASFKAGQNPEERAQILVLLRGAAYFLPELSLDLAKDVRSRMGQTLLEVETEAASDLAYAVGHWQRHFEAAIDLLWDLGKNDARPLNQFSSHGHRHLMSLAKFKPNIPGSHHRIVMAHIERWLGEAKASGGGWAHSPVQILRTLLERDWHQDIYHGNMITWQQGEIPHTEEREALRAEAIALLGRCARAEFGEKIVGEAIQNLQGQLPVYQHGPWKGLGAATLKEWSATADHYLQNRRPAFAFVIYHKIAALDELFDESDDKKVDPESQDLSKNLRAKLERDFSAEFSFLNAVNGYHRLGDTSVDEVKIAQEALSKLAPGEACRMLDDLSRDLVLLGHDPSIAILGTGRTASWAFYGSQLYRELMTNGHEPRLVGHSIVFLWDLRHQAASDEARRKEYLELLKLFSSPKGIPADERPFDSKGYLLWFIRLLLGSEPIHLFPEELELVKKASDQIDMDWSHLVKRLYAHDPKLAKELVLGARPGTSRRAADQMCSTVVHTQKLSSDFLEEDWRTLLDILIDVDQIEGSWTENLLVTLSNRYPRMISGFFQARFQKYSAMGSETGEYRPLPLTVGAEYGNAFSEIPADVRAELIREGIALVQVAERGARFFLYNYLNLIAGRFIVAGHDVLKLMASSADISNVLVAAEVIQHSYSDFVLDHSDIVEILLNSGTLSDEENYNDVLSCLDAGSVRSISRTIGTPSQTHIQLRERAAELKRRFVPATRPYVFYESLEQGAGAGLQREELHDAEIMDQ